MSITKICVCRMASQISGLSNPRWLLWRTRREAQREEEEVQTRILQFLALLSRLHSYHYLSLLSSAPLSLIQLTFKLAFAVHNIKQLISQCFPLYAICSIASSVVMPHSCLIFSDVVDYVTFRNKLLDKLLDLCTR